MKFQESEEKAANTRRSTFTVRRSQNRFLKNKTSIATIHGCHQDYVECGGRVASHFSPRLKFGAPAAA